MRLATFDQVIDFAIDRDMDAHRMPIALSQKEDTPSVKALFSTLTDEGCIDGDRSWA